MSIISIIIVLVAIGFLLWLIDTYVPMPRSFKTILNALVVILVILWIFSELKIIHCLGSLRLR